MTPNVAWASRPCARGGQPLFCLHGRVARATKIKCKPNRSVPTAFAKPLTRLFELAQQKVRLLNREWNASQGTPVFTVEGKYTTRGWTEWTQGFQYGCAILTFDATNDRELLELGRTKTVERMAAHVTHTGVHDHGFNNLSTYGNLRRLMREGRIDHNPWEMNFYELALKASGAVQAARWSGDTSQCASLRRESRPPPASATSIPSTASIRSSSTRCARSASSASPGNWATS